MASPTRSPWYHTVEPGVAKYVSPAKSSQRDIIQAAQYALTHRAASSRAGNLVGYVALGTGHFGNGIGSSVASYDPQREGGAALGSTGGYSPQKAAAAMVYGPMMDAALPPLPYGFRTAALAATRSPSPKKGGAVTIATATLAAPIDNDYSTESGTYGNTVQHVTMQLGKTASKGVPPVLLDPALTSPGRASAPGSRGGRRRNSLLADGPVTGGHTGGSGAYRGPVASYPFNYERDPTWLRKDREAVSSEPLNLAEHMPDKGTGRRESQPRDE